MGRGMLGTGTPVTLRRVCASVGSVQLGCAQKARKGIHCSNDHVRSCYVLLHHCVLRWPGVVGQTVKSSC